MSRRDRLTTSARVALTVTFVLALGVTALSSISYFSVRQRLNVDLDRALLRETEAFATAMGSAAERDPAFDLRAAARTYLETRSAAASVSRPVLLLRLPTGRVISNSDVLLEQASANRGALDTTSAVRAYVDFMYGSEMYRAAVVPIKGATGTNIGVFEAALPLGPSRELTSQLLRILAVASTLVVLLGALLSAMAARTSLAPLRHVAGTAGRITQARLAERIAYDGPADEVGSLVDAVNDMLDRLEAAFREQRRFLADASHELRTPLAIVSGHIEIVTREDLSPAERADELALVADEVARMGRLVDDMLALARLEVEAARPFQLLEVETLLQEAAGRGRVLGERRYRVESEPALWIYGEPDQLMQTLLNLINNAVPHTPEGSEITLSATGTRETVTISIADEGRGIRPEDLERVFDRFFRASGPRGVGGGSGLGLAIVRRLVEMHGGRVEAANRPEGGAVFTITLARAPKPTD
ncbi:MAG: HAMP domain-containing sensor histidine kinase [Coriobacteriia bacterium]|nr:HAMP domain-containing sensor histidine kinase [Coriobacteriia bacterium]